MRFDLGVCKANWFYYRSIFAYFVAQVIKFLCESWRTKFAQEFRHLVELPSLFHLVSRRVRSFRIADHANNWGFQSPFFRYPDLWRMWLKLACRQQAARSIRLHYIQVPVLPIDSFS